MVCLFSTTGGRGAAEGPGAGVVGGGAIVGGGAVVAGRAVVGGGAGVSVCGGNVAGAEVSDGGEPELEG